mgnify:CR=1 FL=1
MAFANVPAAGRYAATVHPIAAKIGVSRAPRRRHFRGEMTNEEAYRKYAPELLRFASGLAGPVDAQDIVTDACLRTFRAKRWPELEHPRAYLYRAVLNEARMHHRSTMRRRAREAQAALPDQVDDAAVDIDVLRAVGELSVRQRAVVFMTYWHDLDADEIARLLGISAGSVRRHLARGRARLKEVLG